jgi:hypothetical protein
MKIKDIVIGSIIFVLIVIFINHFRKTNLINSTSKFANTPQYIAQSLFINIYATPKDFPKYEWLFKGTLNNNILITKKNNYIFIPRTAVNIPINVYNNSPVTKFTIRADDIEQDIQQCDFNATTF